MKLHFIVLSNVLASLAAPVPGPPFHMQRQSSCTQVKVLHARGIAEAGLPLDVDVVPQIQGSLERVYGRHNVVVQGIDYVNEPLSAVTDAHISPMVSSTMIDENAMRDCPASKVILVGYGEGAELVHYALKALGPKAANVAAAITFADPVKDSGWGILPIERTKVMCPPGDAVDKGNILVSRAHLSDREPGVAVEATAWLEGLLGKPSGDVAALLPRSVPSEPPSTISRRDGSNSEAKPQPPSAGEWTTGINESTSSFPTSASGSVERVSADAKGAGALQTHHPPAKPAGWLDSILEKGSSIFGKIPTILGASSKESSGLLENILGPGTTTVTTSVTTGNGHSAASKEEDEASY
ncbi:hypothetical protein FKW77_009495 [Venturia effusa]|uniref:cutinase n=1 Tax=Venturia effusa TaxID=50376 RepID=A0A517LD10_9PEZI|nr:hypothetical protein FKW77_009495 [Venturia effusa]